MVQVGLLELVGRSDSDWASDSATRQSVTGHHCDVQNVTMCNRSPKQTAISLTSREAEFYAASACAGQPLGIADFFKEQHYNFPVRLEMDSDSARHILQRRGAGGLKQDAWLFNRGYEKNVYRWERVDTKKQHCRSVHETSGWIANTVAREETWTSNPGVRMVQMGTIEEWWRQRTRACKQRSQLSRGCKYSQFKQLTECTLRRHFFVH